MSSDPQPPVTIPDVAYYYPAPYWSAVEGGWVKSLLLFFDRISILLPAYMRTQHRDADPSLAEPLEDLGLLEVLDPSDWVDQRVTEQLTAVMTDLLVAGAFNDLPHTTYFHELSQSRMGYGADIGLATMLIEELVARDLARPTEDGVSIPLHPVVRRTILVVLGQLARARGQRSGVAVHPATNDLSAARDLIATLGLPGLPSAGHLVTLDMEVVGLDLDSIPLDEVLDFRASHLAAHTAYMRSLRGALEELSAVPETDRAALLMQRQQEIIDAAHDLRRLARRSFGKNLAAWSLGAAGATWGVVGQDPLGLAITAAGLVAGAVPSGQPAVSAYSYVFAASHQLAR